MTIWLMPNDWVARMEAVEATPIEISIDIDPSVATPMKIQRGVATIHISGVLVKERDPRLDRWGIRHTAYTDIEEQTDQAIASGAKKLRYKIDSPGGDANGIVKVMDKIASISIPTITEADGSLTSGAYMIASQTDKIIATNDMVFVGSIGIAIDCLNVDWIKSIANRDSERKRPDVSKLEGVEQVKDQLDDFFGPIVTRVATGRKTTVDKVKRDYGQGAVMTARTALQKKMIDGIMNNQPAESKAAKIGDKMDPKTLKEEHRATYDAIFEAGKEAGSKEEHERACAHLILAEGSGDVEAAHKAIKDGEGITEMVKAQHMSAAMKRNMIQARQDDNPPEINTAGDAAALTASQDEKDRQAFLAKHKGWVVE